MQFASLDAWLAWLEQAHPREIDLGLERIRQVAQGLQLCDPGVPVVTVAGTNGKGSCVAAIAALAKAAGLRVGVYTSPHLRIYNERICIDGEAASDQQICAAFERIFRACEGVSLTYFEFGTLAALEIFRNAQVDLLVLEVGLGGRLDAVNLLDPDIAVITSIDLDHQDWLGDTREAIGREKAGILRDQRPLICADSQPPQSLLDQIAKLAVPVVFIGQNFGFRLGSEGWYWWGQDAQGESLTLGPLPQPNLPLPSLAAALQVALQLRLNLSTEQLVQILAHLRLPGRFQRLDWQGREVILDVAHNPAASRYLAERLADLPVPRRRLALVAMMVDKDRLSSLEALVPLVDAWYPVALPVARAASCAQIIQDLTELHAEVAGEGSVSECLEQARAASEPGDQIVVWGSFYTVAAALNELTPGCGRQG